MILKGEVEKRTSQRTSQAGDADSSRAPGLTSGLQGSVNVHRGALLLVPQWQCISSFVFYIPVYHYFAVSTRVNEMTQISHHYRCKSVINKKKLLIKTWLFSDIRGSNARNRNLAPSRSKHPEVPGRDKRQRVATSGRHIYVLIRAYCCGILHIHHGILWVLRRHEGKCVDDSNGMIKWRDPIHIPLHQQKIKENQSDNAKRHQNLRLHSNCRQT